MPAPSRLTPQVRLALFYAAAFAVVGVHLPFWPVWLRTQGQDPAAIGLLLAVGVWVRLASNPFVAHLADRSGERKRFILALAWGSLAAFALFALARDFTALLLVSLLFGFLWSPLVPLGDDLTLLVAYDKGLDYGRIRLFGSLSFIVAATLAGWLVARSGSGAILALLLLALGGNALLAFCLPNRRATPAARKSVPALTLLRDRRFLLFVLAAGLLQGSHAVYYAFSSLYWHEAGISQRTIGLLWSEGVLAEIGLFLLSPALLRRLERLAPRKRGLSSPLVLLLLAAFGGLVRWSACALTTAPQALFVLQALHALTFAAAHLGAMHFIARTVPAGHTASAQSLYSALTGGLIQGLTLILSGPLYAHFGGGAFFAMAAMSLAGGGGTLLLARFSSAAARPRSAGIAA